MFGDDWAAEFPGVINAVLQFASDKDLLIETYPGDKWLIRKPIDSVATLGAEKERGLAVNQLLEFNEAHDLHLWQAIDSR